MNRISKSSFGIFFSLVTLSNLYAQKDGKEDSIFINPTYRLGAFYIEKTLPNTIEWEIGLRHSNSDSTVFIYSSGQYCFTFNPAIANGGTLTYSIIYSDLPEEYRPINPAVSGINLILEANVPTTPELSPLIIDKSNGTIVARVRLRTSAASFNHEPFFLKWKNYEPGLYTKIFAFTGLGNQAMVDISTPDTHTIDEIMLIQNNFTDPLNTSRKPERYSLSQNFPNPFNPSTQIDYALPVNGSVSILVYDLVGRQIIKLVNTYQTAGFHTVNFNASNLASGMYFYRINVEGEESKNYNATKRMILVK